MQLNICRQTDGCGYRGDWPPEPPGSSDDVPQSYLLHVDVLLCTRLKKVDPHLLGELLRVRRLDHLGVGIVVLVSHCDSGENKNTTQPEPASTNE